MMVYFLFPYSLTHAHIYKYSFIRLSTPPSLFLSICLASLFLLSLSISLPVSSNYLDNSDCAMHGDTYLKPISQTHKMKLCLRFFRPTYRQYHTLSRSLEPNISLATPKFCPFCVSFYRLSSVLLGI